MRINFRGSLRDLLNPPPRQILWDGELLDPVPGGWGELQIVIPRSRCRFGRFDLSRLPAPKRNAALGLQLSSWAPFQSPDHLVAWTAQGHAMVWSWDGAAVLRSWEAIGTQGKLPRCIPEPLLRESPTSDGVRLFPALQGFEAQYWADAEIVASRWWPASPSSSERLQFVRDCALGPDAALQVIDPAPALAKRTWTIASRVSDGDITISPKERAVYWVLALSLCIPAVLLAVEHGRLAHARMTVQGEIASASEQSRVLIEARETALNTAAQVRALQQLQPYPSPLMIMLALARALPDGGGSVIKEWELNGDKLRLLIVSPSAELAGAEHVRALEAAGLFREVKLLTQSDPRQMAFSLQLKSQQELAVPVAAMAEGGSP